ncbi:SPOR domain-containing protein [Cellulosimicrobium sp. NPDC057127]|uniref:SPOR domain-containing protein n=1 Tax=Cellulosimicrobium sp. NPDC057127 TaxID=3346026 RepID=UPI00363981A6
MSTSRFSDDGDPASQDQYYFDTRTGEVHRGPSGSWSHRMGPYATREEAERALQTAHERSEAWDEEDRREREE